MHAMLLMLLLSVPAPGVSALQRAQDCNLAQPWLMPAAAVDSVLVAEARLTEAQRAGRWARRFADAPAEYRFGLDRGGYAAEGLLVRDDRHDCVSLLYRVTELARAGSAADAVRLALATRFAGADPESVVTADGRVDYDRPEHLDFSLDMVRSGHWGADVTASLAGAVRDSAGSSRYPPGSFHYLPALDVTQANLREGDVAWLVLSPAHPQAAGLRREHGLVIGHIGILIMEDERPWLVHAARSGLPGWYEGGRVAKVPLEVYLERVERFCGVVITRLGATASD
ncbi:MAG: hypothetical protein R6X25_02480 [Candidatus Krumholzibacteriia bacterium]